MKKLLIGLVVVGSISSFASDESCDESIINLVSKAKSLQVSESLQSIYSSKKFKTYREMDSYRGYVSDVKNKTAEVESLKQEVKVNCLN